MPELPEVETIRLGLSKKIVGLTLKHVQVLSEKSFTGDVKKVEGKKVNNVWRRAKMLGIDLSSHKSSAISPFRLSEASSQTKKQKSLKAEGRQLTTILFHLKMTGQLILIQKSNIKDQNDKSKLKTEDRFIGGHPTKDMIGSLPNAHTRVIFTFSDNSKFYFNDQRRFGWIRVSGKAQVTSDKLFQRLGPEPLEKGFTWQILKSNLIKHKSMPIKVAIMDQTVVAGVGNIYASEACFDAKIDPRTKVKDLSDEQFKSLHRAVQKALRDGIKHGGSSRAHFVDADGHKGYFLDYVYCYGRDKHPCKKCGTEIKKIQLGGRGTYHCPVCQR